LTAARARGFAVRAHAGQFADLGAAGLVASLGGLSADHLEHVSEEQALAMAAAGTIATLLPGACVQLRLPPPPVVRLRAAGCRFALGTDLNPGSSMSESLPLQMWLATTHLGLTVEEAWLAVTRDAARAAGRPEAGRLLAGAPADLVLWDATDYRTIPYHYGARHVHTGWVAGREIVGPQSHLRCIRPPPIPPSRATDRHLSSHVLAPSSPFPCVPPPGPLDRPPPRRDPCGVGGDPRRRGVAGGAPAHPGRLLASPPRGHAVGAGAARARGAGAGLRGDHGHRGERRSGAARAGGRAAGRAGA